MYFKYKFLNQDQSGLGNLILDLQVFKKIMLTIKELQALYELLNKKEETLQQIESLFLSKFKDSQAVFKASFALSNLISFNLLCPQQRIVAIFLLIENYSKDGIHKHPFGATIFQTINNTQQSFQKKMIYDLILEKKRDQVLSNIYQYSKIQIEVLYEKQQAMIESVQEKPEFNTLKQQFIHKLPPLPESSKSQVSRVIKDFNEKQKQFEPPQLPINVSSFKQSQISNETFNVGFLRPIPQFLPVGEEEFHWLIPLKVPDIQWDNTAEIEKKIAKIKTLMKKAQEQHLTKDECTQIERGLQSEPNIVLHLGITTQNISLLIKQNPFLAVAFLTKLSTFPIIQEYLQVIKDGEVSMNSIDVISRITKLVKIDSRFLAQYLERIMEKVMQGTEKSIDKPKLARMIINLIKNLKKNKLLNLQDIQGKLDKFVHEFIEVEQVEQFRKMWV